MSALEFLPANARTPLELVDLFHRSFEGYAVHFRFTLETFLTRMRFDLVDFSRSLIARRDGEDIALALLSPRGQGLRIAAMGIVTAARRQGVGRAVMQEVFERAHESELELEVMTSNAPAIALYERCGFRKIDRLSGFLAENPSAQANARLHELDVRQAAHLVALHADPDLPWQCAAPALMTLAYPHSAWQLGEASLILGDTKAAELRILSFLTPPARRRRGQGRHLLAAMFARYPERRWFVPPICPSEHAGFFLHCGLTEHPLSQWRMRRSGKQKED